MSSSPGSGAGRSAKEIVLAAGGELFGALDARVVDKWFSEGFVQHDPTVADGRQGLRAMLGMLGDDFRYEVHRVLEDGDHVALHVTYEGFGPGPMVAFDVFRVEDGRIAEHWDALQPLTGESVSGRSETDGPTEVVDLDRTEANRALVTGFVEGVLMGGGRDVTEFIDAHRYHQHDPHFGDGLEGLRAGLVTFAGRGQRIAYRALHKTVAQGNFVLTLADGAVGPAPSVFYDLFRVEDGRIVEHWDVIQPIPETTAHDHGMF
ncbi:nuclear transport factor 2 family protein [Streptomyces purpureus]|uniref:Polyketide cyclase n=1 Tax=Streptomyces purpureus TaxID=1951 RepID=A0A918HIU3_9ACTN|nr:nuclear transport factor 2 family protein [Streptomyces purpureus]GGT61909.1 polyketide cyclase [Streptomyces purpureus]